LVLNADPDCFAHAYQATQGPSVCAICVKADDAAATLDHADALKDVPFRQPVGPVSARGGGLGDSLDYFVDAKSELARIWSVDFDPRRAGSAP
jgi:3-dehydroshikimate dehydratase